MSMAIKQAKQRAGAQFSSVGSGVFVGDPGIFGSIFSGFKKAAGFIPGPIGAVARQVFGPTRPAPTGPILVRPPTNFPGPQGPLPFPAQNLFQEAPFPTNGGTPRGADVEGEAIARALPFGKTGIGKGCLAGFHPNKTAYWTKKEGFIEVGTKCVKNRRRNPLNPRAASRAIARLRSAKKADRAIRSVTIRCTRCNKNSDTCGCR